MMKDATSLGGASSFSNTRDTVVYRLKSPNAPVRDAAFEVVVKFYWKPLYKHFRLKWKFANNDAKDLTQDFFVSLFDSKTLQSFDSQKSSFRHYLKVCADRFAANYIRDSKRIKRGGNVSFLSLDFSNAESEIQDLDTGGATDRFQLDWISNLIEISTADLKKSLIERGKTAHFQIIYERDIQPECDEDVPSYQDLATKLNLTRSQVTNYLALARREFRAIVINNLRDLTCSENEFEAELSGFVQQIARSQQPK